MTKMIYCRKNDDDSNNVVDTKNDYNNCTKKRCVIQLLLSNKYTVYLENYNIYM